MKSGADAANPYLVSDLAHTDTHEFIHAVEDAENRANGAADDGTLRKLFLAEGLPENVAAALAERFGSIENFKNESTKQTLKEMKSFLSLGGVNHNIGEFHTLTPEQRKAALQAYRDITEGQTLNK